MDVVQAASITHEANRALCIAQGDMSQPNWEDAPDWQSKSAIQGVLFHLDHPDSKPSDSHAEWMNLKLVEGWVYGEVKDAEKKTHPCLVPFEELPADQQVKDHLFLGIVRALEPFIER